MRIIHYFIKPVIARPSKRFIEFLLIEDFDCKVNGPLQNIVTLTLEFYFC